MRKLFILLLIVIVAAGLIFAQTATPKKKTVKDLPQQYRKWLEEEVGYIITAKERDVFLQLDSDRERNIFIEAFWKQRNPDPNSAENAFKIEHYKRIQFANQWLGKNSPTPGWRTDRGRIYILLGQPKEIQTYENLFDLRPVITWFYDGMAEYNLPGSFYVVFWKKDIVDDYRLYSPISDGPQQLMQHYMGDMTDSAAAYDALVKIEPNVANVSLSFIPGEQQFSATPSLASEILIKQGIPDAPHVKVKDEYAEKLLKYKNIIEVDYTTNYVASETLINVFQDASGLSFVHYLIEPKKLTFEQTATGYHTQLEITGRVSDAKNPAVTVYQFDRSWPFEMSEAMMAQVKSRFFSFQDLFPVAPGQYKVSLLLKNRLSREFTSAEADILVPDTRAFAMSPPVLAYKTDRTSRFRGQNKAYLLGNVQFVPSPRNAFAADDTLSIFFQLRNVPADLRAGGAVQYAFDRQSETMKLPERGKVITRNLRDLADLGAIVEEVALSGLPASHYALTVSVLDASGAEKLKTKLDFDIRSATALNRALVISMPQPPTSDPSFANILGAQYLAKENLAAARPLLEDAYRRDSTSAKYALDYVRALVKAKEYRSIGDVAKPFLGDDRRFEFLEYLGAAEQELGSYAAAIAHYKDYLSHFGTSIPILNAVGECYVKLGNPAEALVAWERSIQLEPKQPALQDKIRALKDKK